VIATLNARVDIDHESPQKVAREFLQQHKLL
ncbi:MAG TPA: glycine/betaine ABC transporter substrate-binding protein, partial [Enterobacteriaceae bacterium]|nr:glycine/betaine ABC transporter substrate-binding protein [Enterobacteriaceae bacterium]